MVADNIKQKPIENVILVSFDSLRSDYVANLSPKEAPNFCLVRDRGCFFRNTIVQAPFTVPSHISMLTGLYPAKTGVRDMHHRIPQDISTVFTILKKEKFSTILASHTRIFANQRFQGIDQHIPLNKKSLARTICQVKQNRFFAFLHYWDTHTPYETRLPILGPVDLFLNIAMPLAKMSKWDHIRYLARIYEILWLMKIKRIRTMMKKQHRTILPLLKKGYKDAIIKADAFLGDILRVLHTTDTAQRTLLIITGDHGDSFNEHNEIERAHGERYEHGQFLYDSVLRVPLILFSPQKSISSAFDSQVQQIDIVPTLLEALEIENERLLDGIPLWDKCVMKGEEPLNAYGFSEVVRESLGIELRCVRSNNYKLIHDHKNDIFELYDLKVDPDEECNLWLDDDYKEHEALKDRLEAFAQLENQLGTAYSAEEQRAIEKTLHDLGYM